MARTTLSCVFSDPKKGQFPNFGCKLCPRHPFSASRSKVAYPHEYQFPNIFRCLTQISRLDGWLAELMSILIHVLFIVGAGTLGMRCETTSSKDN